MSKLKRYSKVIESNLIKCYLNSTFEEKLEGYNWYNKAYRVAADIAWKYDLSINKVCGVIAALSPGREWNLNIKDTKSIVHAHANLIPYPSVGTYGRINLEKAKNILKSKHVEPLDFLGGKKVINFYNCLIDPENNTSVVIDRHAISAALQRNIKENELKFIFKLRYEFLKEQYLKGAEKLGVLPNKFQATIWLYWKRVKWE